MKEYEKNEMVDNLMEREARPWVTTDGLLFDKTRPCGMIWEHKADKALL